MLLNFLKNFDRVTDFNVINFLQGDKFLRQLDDPKSKIAVTIDEDSFTAFKHNLVNLPKFLTEKLTFLKGIGTNHNNHAFWLIEDTMQILISAGIPQWYRKFIFEVLFWDVRHEEKEPKKFGFDDLAFGFVIWGVACLVTIVVFMMELIWFYLRKLILNLAGIFVLMKGLKFI